MIDIAVALCIFIGIGLIPDENKHSFFLATFEWRESPDLRVSARDCGGGLLPMTFTCKHCHKRFEPTYKTQNQFTFCSRTCLNTSRREEALANASKRFWGHVEIKDKDDCWIWTRSSGRGGYGTFVLCSIKYQSHRYAFFLTKGYFPQKPYEVCHTCDYPPCCNPCHLFAGTRSDNVQDCIAKGRFGNRGGENAPNAKLTSGDVLFIRKMHIGPGIFARRNVPFSTQWFADRFGVTYSAISRIISGRSWKNI